MELLPGASSLARALLMLSRGGATGVLHVVGDGRAWRLAVADGALRAVAGEKGEVLGDALVGQGLMDPEAHRAALSQGSSASPIGRWLVSRGLTSQSAVDGALRQQMLAGLVTALSAESLEYRFEAGEADVGVPWAAEVAVADLVLDAMRQAVSGLGLRRLMRGVPTGEIRLNSLGRTMVMSARLSDRERIVLDMLAGGAHFAAVVTATAGCQRTLTTLAVLGMLRCVVGRELQRGSYALLLRKRRQLRQQESAEALLDLHGQPTPAQSRRALRTLARKLHPDRLGPDAPAGLRRASNEVLGALIRAERELRAGQ